MFTSLIRLSHVDESDFGIEALEFQMLMRAFNDGEDVKVLRVAVDNGERHENNYYDIELSNGLKIDALSGYHLANIENFRDDTLVCQYVVEVSFKRFHSDATVAHMELQDLIQEAVAGALHANRDKVSTMEGKCTSVQFETDYLT